jgi:HEAT repeat protein
MESNDRLNTIRYLLDTALDSEEEYVYHGEMADYMRSYAADAAEELDWLFRGSPPAAEEIDLCVKALSDPERIRRGRSKELLLRLRERSRPILDALANSPDPHLRIFALETGRTSLNPYFPDPLYGFISLNRQLLEDPDENVRAAALSTALDTMVHNAQYLEDSIRRGDSNPLLGFLSEALALLGDPSPEVQAEAANVLARWAAKVDREIVESFLGREDSLAAREILAKARATGDPATANDRPALNDPDDEGRG